MANVSSINGFRVVGSTSPGSHTGKVTLYYVASAADELFVGDIVKYASTADANGIPGADLAGASDVPLGVVVGIVNSKISPVGNMSNGSINLDLPAAAQIAASTSGYILVNDDPYVLLEAEVSNGSFAITDIGLNASHSNGGTRDSTVSTSPAYIDGGTEGTAATLNFNLRGFSRKVNNEIGASAKILVGFNVHQFKSVGVLGIA